MWESNYHQNLFVRYRFWQSYINPYTCAMFAQYLLLSISQFPVPNDKFWHRNQFQQSKMGEIKCDSTIICVISIKLSIVSKFGQCALQLTPPKTQNEKSSNSNNNINAPQTFGAVFFLFHACLFLLLVCYFFRYYAFFPSISCRPDYIGAWSFAY